MTEQNQRIRAAICYFPVFGFLYSFLTFLKKGQSKVVKFHAAQSLLIGTGFLLAMLTVMFLALFAPGIGLSSFFATISLVAFTLASNYVVTAGFILTLILMAIGYTGRIIKVPMIGDAAEELSTGS